jgi:glycerophosphoryl diester phosphodiesterase
VLSRTQVIAHRGASRAESENTLAAFRRAGQMGAQAVELDVRRTSDGVLVIHHNPHLADLRVIAETPFEGLPGSVPTLGQALDACDGMWVNVEIKNDPNEPDFDLTESIADETMAHLLSRGEDHRWLISCFRLDTVDRCRTLAPQIRTAWLCDAVRPGTAEELTMRGHSAVHPWVGLLTREMVDTCHAAGLQVNTWTCDDPTRMAELVEWGIDGICTNVPDVALRVLAGEPA